MKFISAGRLLFFTLFLTAGLARSEDAFMAPTYRDLYIGIASNYKLGFSSGPFESPEINTLFSNPDDNLLFKIAAESETRRIIFPKKKIFILHPSYLDWMNNKNLLRDRYGNSDFYLVQVLDSGLEVVGRLPLYRMCKEYMNSGNLFFNCQHVEQNSPTLDVYKYDGTSLSKTKSGPAPAKRH